MRLFIILPRVPYPTEKGDKLRAFYQIRQLSKMHEIILCAFNDGDLHEDALPVLKQYVKAVHIIPLSKPTIFFNIVRALFSGKPLQVGYFYNRSSAAMIGKLIQKYQPDHLFCQLIRVAEYARGISIPKTLDYQDVFSKGIERRIANAPFYLKPLLRIEYQRLLRYEQEVFDLFDHKLIISRPDRDLIPHKNKQDIVVVANGVDTHFFHPVNAEKQYDLVFTGNMGYPPNIEAAEFLVNKILPLVSQKYPGIRLLIAGANPNLRVMVLKSSRVTVSGWVPDIRDCYASARIFIAPMQTGTGLQNKILEAMAMKIPCITSALAFNALNAVEDHDILVAGSATEYCARILELLNDPGKASVIAENGFQFVMKNFNWETETNRIHEIISGQSAKKYTP